MARKYLADVTSAGKPAHGPATALNPKRCPHPLGDYLTTRKCDGCGTATDTSFDDPDHTCGLCDVCWSGLNSTQQEARYRQVVAQFRLAVQGSARRADPTNKGGR